MGITAFRRTRKLSSGMRVSVASYACLCICFACAIQASEDASGGDYVANAMHSTQLLAQPNKVERRGALHKVGISVGKRDMEAKAAEMLDEEERSEDMIHREASEYHKKYTQPELGEGATVADDSAGDAPWAGEDKKKKKMQKVHKQESRIQQEMDRYDVKRASRAAPGAQQVAAATSEEPDLGESVSVSNTVSDSNALTMRAQARAHAQTKVRQRVIAIKRAKQIADKVRALVKKQQTMEKKAGAHVQGSILGEAVKAHDKAAAVSAQDELLAHKMEDEQAQSTMQHLIETERKEQVKAFATERKSTANALTKLRAKLKLEQDKMIKQVRAETTQSVVNVEKSLSKTSVATAIENVVKKKLAKRLNELKTAGLKQVTGVTAQVNALQHKVRRLRREQTRLKIKTASMRRNLRPSRRDLGESSGVGIAQALQKAQITQMLMQQQQMQPQMQQQMQQQQQVQSEELAELLRMREQMAQMQKQNAALKQMYANKATAQLAQAAPTHYSHRDLQNFFARKNSATNAIRQRVLAEKKKLQQLEVRLSAADKQPNLSPLQDPQMLVQLSEGATEPASATPTALYNQHAEQARVEMEELQRKAEEEFQY